MKRFELPSDKVPTVGQRVFLMVNEQSVMVFNIDHQLYAINDSCPHQGASLFGGKVENCTIKCPAHGLRFNLADGYMANSDLLKLTTYPVEQVGEKVFILLNTGEQEVSCE